VTRLQAGWSGVRIPAGERYVSSPKQQGLDLAKPPGRLPLRVKRLAMKLTTHLHPVLTLRMSGAVPPWSLYAFLFQSAYVNITPLDAFKGAMVSFTILSLSLSLTHTHTHIYIYIFVGKVGWSGKGKNFPSDFDCGSSVSFTLFARVQGHFAHNTIRRLLQYHQARLITCHGRGTRRPQHPPHFLST
jgi:hypothetical protein